MVIATVKGLELYELNVSVYFWREQSRPWNTSQSFPSADAAWFAHAAGALRMDVPE